MLANYQRVLCQPCYFGVTGPHGLLKTLIAEKLLDWWVDECIQGKGLILLKGMIVSESRTQGIRRKQDRFSRNAQSSKGDGTNHQGTAMSNVRQVELSAKLCGYNKGYVGFRDQGSNSSWNSQKKLLIETPAIDLYRRLTNKLLCVQIQMNHVYPHSLLNQ